MDNGRLHTIARMESSADERQAQAGVLRRLRDIGITDELRGDDDPLLLNIMNSPKLARRGFPVVIDAFAEASDPRIASQLAIGLAFAPPSQRSLAAGVLFSRWIDARSSATRTELDLAGSIESSLARVIRDDDFSLIERAMSIDPSRAYFFVLALGNMKKRRDDAIAIALGLVTDDDLGLVALQVLGTLKSEEARRHFDDAVLSLDSAGRAMGRRGLRALGPR